MESSISSWSEYRIAVLDTLKRLESYCHSLEENKADAKELAEIVKQVAHLATQLSILQVESAVTKTKLAIWCALPSSAFGAAAAYFIEHAGG